MEEAWVLLQHPPRYAVACYILKKAERGLCCFKCKVSVCPPSRGGAQGGKASCTGSGAHSHTHTWPFASSSLATAVTFSEKEERF